jgi:enoyl-CoA hydratase
VSGAEARNIGLVNASYPEEHLFEEAKNLARKISNKSSLTTNMVLELVQYSDNERYEEGQEREAELFGKAFDAEEGQEGIRAFIEKRVPSFKGK